MHPLLRYVLDEIRSWSYDGPAALTLQVSRLLREVLSSGGRLDDVPEFVALNASLSDFSVTNTQDIYHALHQWDDLADAAHPGPNADRMISFKLGIIWVTSRSLMLYFNPDEKIETFLEWQEFTCRSIEKYAGMFLTG